MVKKVGGCEVAILPFFNFFYCTIGSCWEGQVALWDLVAGGYVISLSCSEWIAMVVHSL